MQTNIIYALVVMGAITAGTIGFANTLTVNANAINPIGGNAGTVDTPTGEIIAVTWNEIATALGDIALDSADVTVANGDTTSDHTYQICVVLSDGTTSSGLNCQLTGSITQGTPAVIVVGFTPDFDTILATQLYITLEELT